MSTLICGEKVVVFGLGEIQSLKENIQEKDLFFSILIGWELVYSRANAYAMEIFAGSVRLCLCLLYHLKFRNECCISEQGMQ